MQFVKKYFSVIFLCVLSATLFSVDIVSIFFFKETPEQIIQSSQQDIEKLYASTKPQPAFRNDYFELTLPSGMEFFAIDKNNFKVRYHQLFFEVHTFTSKITSEEYSKTKFLNEKKYILPNYQNQKVFFYLKEQNTRVFQLALYTDGIEIVVVVPQHNVQETLLKSVELMRNITPLENAQEGIVIGNNGNGNKTPAIQNFGDGDQENDESNKEMPIVKS